MKNKNPIQSLYLATARTFTAIGVAVALYHLAKKIPESIQMGDFTHWSYVVTNEIPTYLEQNMIGEARGRFDEVKEGIEEYKNDDLQAGFQIPPRQLDELEARLDWSKLMQAHA